VDILNTKQIMTYYQVVILISSTFTTVETLEHMRTTSDCSLLGYDTMRSWRLDSISEEHPAFIFRVKVIMMRMQPGYTDIATRNIVVQIHGKGQEEQPGLGQQNCEKLSFHSKDQVTRMER
jgi:hypothetical protein